MDEEEKKDKKAQKKQQENDSSKKAAGVAAKGAIDYFTGGKGGQVYDAAKKIPGVGKQIDQAEEKLGKSLNQATGGKFGKVAKKADDIGALDAADSALSMGAGGGGKTGSPNGRVGSSPNSNNVGKNSLNHNGGIVKPATSPLDQEKEKNQNHLQDQLQKNTLRMITNAFMPSLGANTTNTLDQLGNKNKQKNEQEEGESKDPSTFMGDINFKKVLPILLPSMGGFLLVIIVITVALSGFYQFRHLIGVGSSGIQSNIGGASGGDKKVEEMYDRILRIQQEYSTKGKNFSADLISSVFQTLSSRIGGFNPTNLTDAVIREIADYMFVENCSEFGCTYTYSETTFKENLTNHFFPRYLKKDLCQDATDEVFQRILDYQKMIGYTKGASSGNGVCTYDIPGFVIGNSIRPVNLIINNLQFRSLQTPQFGGVSGGVLDNGNLVDFEKYVLGVTWGEYSSGNSEAEKAMLIAARSYALARPYSMGFAGGRKLAQENGQWVLALQNSVMDQVYCDPDQGCSRDVNSGQNSQLYSGTTTGPYIYKPAISSDHALRVYASQVNGVVLTDDHDNIISTSYNSTIQKDFGRLGQSGLDYVAILLTHYSKYGATKVKQMNCSSGSSGGGYASWKQTDSKWANISLGKSNIAKIGCLATSISMLIAKSGVTANVNGEFNPGTFVQAMSSVGGFDSAGNLHWNKTNQVANNFNYVNKMDLSGKSKAEKLFILNGLLNQGYYMVCEVKGNTGQHWVAIDSINGENITMMDPGSSATNMWSQYNWQNTSAVSYFKVS